MARRRDDFEVVGFSSYSVYRIAHCVWRIEKQPGIKSILCRFSLCGSARVHILDLGGLEMSTGGRMAKLISERHLKQARVVNFMLVLSVVVMSVVVDGNGRIFGLGEKISSIIVVCFFSCGILLSMILGIADKRHRIWAVVCLIVYLVLAAPAILPL